MFGLAAQQRFGLWVNSGFPHLFIRFPLNELGKLDGTPWLAGSEDLPQRHFLQIFSYKPTDSMLGLWGGGRYSHRVPRCSSKHSCLSAHDGSWRVGGHLQGPQSKGQAWCLLTRQECTPQLQTPVPESFQPLCLWMPWTKDRRQTKFKAKVLTCTQGPGGQHPAIMASEGHFFAWLCFDYVRDGLGVTVWLC